MNLRSFRACLDDDSGQGLVEYALIIALVAMVALTALRVLGSRTKNTFGQAANAFS